MIENAILFLPHMSTHPNIAPGSQGVVLLYSMLNPAEATKKASKKEKVKAKAT